jgi:RluA family pseudouridine synthase
MRTLYFQVTDAEAGHTVCRLLTQELGLPSGMIRGLKWRPGTILRNGAPARVVERVRSGDVLAVVVEDRPSRGVFSPADLQLRVLYQDDDLLIIDKPAGLPVHHGGGSMDTPTVGEGVAFLLGAGTVFHPVSRLDRGTSGVLCVAKSGYIHDRLRRILHTQAYHREYLAVVVGAPLPPDGVVTWGIARDPVHGGKRRVSAEGAPSRTVYATLATAGGLALLRVTPHTGRTHQIRVHLSAIGCPLVGDALYGSADPRIRRPALHAVSLRLTHPVTGERLHVEAPLPTDLRDLLTSFPPEL